ncbi:MAG: hypothetical protein JWR55_2930 [Aeromicrobium sp.]|nr:hypothetical protein [Aeromicrobium sp.]
MRFAREMNGSWTSWSQQPSAYRDAFRVVADAVHDATPDASMLWSPAYGAGYPFVRADGAVDGSGPRVAGQLDTNDDGTFDASDDPHAPYYPGDSAVDWVGLSIYHFGRVQNFGENIVPEAGDLAARLDETYGYDARADRPDPLYETYAEGRDQPMAIETGALFNPGDTTAETSGDDLGEPELAIKRAWWRQVFSTGTLTDHPRIQAIAWLEKKRKEAEVDGQTVDWRATHTPELASAFLRDARTAGLTTGPVTRVLDQEAGNEATAQYRENGPDIGDHMGWIIGCAVLALGLFAFSGIAGRYITSWRYPNEHDSRDQRLDFLRGWTIAAVVVTHIELSGPYSFITLNAIGGITGAEMFVLLFCVVLGMVYPTGIRRLGEWATAVGAFRRARKQYLTALGVVVVVYLIGMLPLVSAKAITTFTDRGTGANGDAASGQVYDLYSNVARLVDYRPRGTRSSSCCCSGWARGSSTSWACSSCCRCSCRR